MVIKFDLQEGEWGIQVSENLESLQKFWKNSKNEYFCEIWKKFLESYVYTMTARIWDFEKILGNTWRNSEKIVAWATTIKFLKLSLSYWPVIDFRSGQWEQSHSGKIGEKGN